MSQRKTFKSYLVVLFIVLLLGIGSASYYITNPGTNTFRRDGGSFFSTDHTGTADFDRSMCMEGQDFILNVNPLKCSPSVVRSDLLEEEDVPVFCEIDALKINPLIDVNLIRDIKFKWDSSPEIKSIRFFQNYAALGPNQRLNNLQSDSVGNAVIVLRKNPDESSMPDYVEANLTARLKYDLNDAFGVRYPRFYLPVMSDSEFDENSGRYPFLDKRGFLRAEAIGDNSARIAVYSDYYESPFGKSREGEIEKERMGFYDLKVGESTPTLYLPGYDCYAGVKIKLLDLDNPDTTARFLVGTEEVELRRGEKFLDEKCTVSSVDDLGVSKSVDLSCQTDDGRKTFSLVLSQKVRLEIEDEVKDYSLGDYLFSFNAKDSLGNDKGLEHAYLGVIGSVPAGDGSINDLQVHIVSTTERRASLSDEEVNILNDFAARHSENENGILASIGNIFEKTTVTVKRIISGTNYVVLEKDGEKGEFGNYDVYLEGLAEVEEPTLEGIVQSYFENANTDFDNVIDGFSEEEYNSENLGVKSYHEKINLASSLGQKRMALELCNEFEDFYPGFQSPIVCEEKGLLYGDSRDRNIISVGGQAVPIILKEVSSPTHDEYSAEITIRGKDGSVLSSPELTKDKIVYIDGGYYEGDFVKLVDLKEEEAKIQISYVDNSSITGGRKTITKILKLDDPESFGTDYVFRLEQVNLKKVAKVLVNTKVDAAGSRANFSVRIGVEKRAIQLSPNKTSERIDKLNNTIESFEGVTEKIETVEKGMKAACLATGGVLTLKNLINGMGGKALARNEVMSGTGGWNEKCKNALNERKANGDPVYVSFEDCLFENSDEIDEEVNEFEEAMNEQNEEFKEIYQDEGILSEGTFQDSVLNRTKLADKYTVNVRDSLDNLEGLEGFEDGMFVNPENSEDESDNLNLESLKGVLDGGGFNEQMYSLEEAKKIELYAKLLREDPNNEAYRQRLYNTLEAVSTVSEDYSRRENWATELDIPSEKIGFIYLGDKEYEKENSIVYEGLTYGDAKSMPEDDLSNNPVHLAHMQDGRRVALELDDSHSSDRLTIKTEEQEFVNEDGEKKTRRKYLVWDVEKEKYLEDSEIPQQIKDLSFIRSEEAVYNNPMSKSDAVVRYHETEPFKGLPAVVPFDMKDGWYAYIEQNLPSFGKIQSYSDSGRVESFYICNVGSNGLMDTPPSSGADNCHFINLGVGQTYESFLGMTKSESSKVLRNANKAIYEAWKGHREGVSKVNILGQTYTVGSPIYETSGYSCTDYMSPKDCQILFNVCDPVICPSSRCDFGGKYPVRDVIQSGVIGSIALCLPNYQEGIYVPICVSGVRAGLEGFGSVLESYRDCLQTSLDTGETVGICDEIHSIYVCEFFWRQAVPLVKFGVPKLISMAKGENTRGGGEYLGVTSAWENAKSSLEYFTNFYAVNSYKAFKARSTEEVGGQFCKVFASISYPQGQGVLDLLLEGDSPHQFNGHFDEIPMTSQTNPPFSHYKVYFHIYAGDDRPAYYRVYLRGGSSSYYQDTLMSRTVDSDYIPRGEYASETIDISAPSGYKELCIRVNDQEECGFGRAGTSFASNYMADQYIQRQANTTDITSERECMSGTTDLYSLTNLNVQEGVGNLADPEIYNKGVVRVCASTNPGEGVASDQAGTENSRWKDVGYCGEKNMRCWIDTQSLEQAFEWEYSYNETQESLNKHYLDELVKSKDGLTHEEFEDELEKILDEDLKLEEKIEMIDSIIGRAIYPEHKAYLYYLRGSYYSELAKRNYVPPEEEIGPIDLDSVFGITSQSLSQGENSLLTGNIIEGDSCINETVEVSKAISSGSYRGISGNGKSLILVSDSVVYENEEGYGMSLKIFSEKNDFKCYSGSLIEGDNLYFIKDNSGENVLAMFELSSNDGFSSVSYSSRELSVGEEVSFVYYDFGLEKVVKEEVEVFGVNDEEFTISHPFEKEARGGLVFDSRGDVLGIVYEGGSDYSTSLNSDYINSQIKEYVLSEGTQGEMPEIREEFILDYFSDENFISPVFRMKNGLFSSDICYQFSEGKWWWTNDCNSAEKGYKSSSYIAGSPGYTGQDGSTISDFEWFDSEDLSLERIDADSEETYKELSGFQRYDDGVEFILKETIRHGNKLEVGEVEVNPDGSTNVFEIGFFENDLFMFYGDFSSRYNKDAWHWSLITDNPDKEGLWVDDLERTSQIYRRGIDKAAEVLNNVWSTITFGLVENKDYSFPIELSNDQKKMFHFIREQTDSEVEGALIIFSYNSLRNSLSDLVQNRNIEMVSAVQQMSPLQIQALVQEMLEKNIILEMDAEFLEENDYSKDLVINLIKNLPDGINPALFEVVNEVEDLERVPASNIGEEIYSVAQSYADSGYDHLRAEGNEMVRDSVCASFATKAMYEAGIREEGFESGTGFCVSIDYLIELFSNSDSFSEIDSGKLQKGDFIVFGYEDERTQHAGIFSKYNSEKERIYVIDDPGEKDNVREISFPIQSDSWYFYKAYRYIGDETSVEEDVFSEDLKKIGQYDFQMALEFIDEYSLEGRYDEGRNSEFFDYLLDVEMILDEEHKKFERDTFSLGSDIERLKSLLKDRKEYVFGEEVEEEISVEDGCSTDLECQKMVGNLVLEYAKDAKEIYGFSDEEVKEDTGYGSFECMVLGQAMQESSLKFCNGFHLEGDPLYCNNNLGLINKGDSGSSYGVMQINSENHPEGDYFTLKDNVDFGISILDQHYTIAEKRGEEGSYYTCKQKFYSGWQLALRYYNGWYPSNCEVGDGDYVENVLGQRSFVEENFPQCNS